MLDENALSKRDAKFVSLLNVATTLPERLKEAMARAEISAADLARRIGVTRATVSFWLTGATKRIEGENLTRTARELRCHAAWLAEGRPPKWIDEPPTEQVGAQVIPMQASRRREWPFRADRELWDQLTRANQKALDGVVTDFLTRNARKGGRPIRASEKPRSKAS